MNSTIIVERDKCLGAGLCTLAPSYFELADDGKVDLLRDVVAAGDDAEVQDAVTMCPAEALRIQAGA